MNRPGGQDGKSRLWISREDIESRMEQELRAAGLYPEESLPVVDLEAFVGSRLKARLDSYASLPQEVLGVTRFYASKRPKILINRDLTEEAMDDEHSPVWLKGRWRSTVAHEASHVILHRALFKRIPATASREQDPTQSFQFQKCLKRDVQFGAMGSDWREVQANQGMAALLMPRALFCAVCSSELGVVGFALGLSKGSKEARALAESMSARFQVSREAAAIRLETLGIVRAEGSG